MKTGEAAHALGIDPKTIVNWIAKPELAKYFSSTAKKQDTNQRMLTDNDVVILNTIRFARANGNDDWISIAEILESGDLQREIPQNAGYVGRTIPEPQARELAVSASTLAERNQLLNQVGELKLQIEKLERNSEADKQQLIKMNGDLQRALTLVELYESGRLKPERKG